MRYPKSHKSGFKNCDGLPSCRALTVLQETLECGGKRSATPLLRVPVLSGKAPSPVGCRRTPKKSNFLCFEEFFNPLLGEIHHLSHLLFGEGFLFGGTLHFDQLAGGGHDNIHVHFSL